jgi:TRAP-type C4-dicarboxylate transport system substrate-binding protein
MKRLGLCVALFLTGALFAQSSKVTIKLGTVAPRDSSFHRILMQMAEQWRKASNGAVELKIYPGGTLGGEAEMVRRMKTGVLDAGLLTCVGLSDIDNSVEALQSLPMMFRSLDEVDYVGVKLYPKMDKKLREKGFVVLFWADTGWVRFFSKKPLATPDDLKKMKLFSWAGDVASVDILKSAGFKPVPLETADILPGLETGLIETVSMPPYVALTTQVYGTANHMLELNWAPLVGGLVVTERAWTRLTPDVQRQLAIAAGEAGRQMKARNRLESDQAVEAMKKRNLVVQPVTPAIEEAWRKAAEAAYPQIRGRIMPADMFDEVKRLLAEYRAAHPISR